MRTFKYLCYNQSIYHLKSNKDKPLFWDDYVRSIDNVLKCEKGVLNTIPYFVNNSLIFYWTPNFFMTLCNFIFRNKIIYLCWGFPFPNDRLYKLKLFRLYLVLKLSNIILVNDVATKKRLLDQWKLKAITIPYFVDTNFFFFKNKTISNKLLIVGNKDRDEEFIETLGSLFYEISRVTSDDKIKSFHVDNRKNSVKVFYKPDYLALRKLYHDCDVFLMPIKNADHAAGQTAVLEAISCGCPVVISDCPSATIFQEFPTVFVSKNDIKSFQENIKLAQQLIKDNSPLMFKSYKMLTTSISSDQLSKIILS